MIDLIKTFLEYVRDKEKPLSRKVIIAILLLLALLALNEYTGFTYYYPVGKEVEIISNIEVAKASTNNQQIINYLNDKENEVIGRKYLHEKFLDLFKKDELKKDVVAFERKPSNTLSDNISGKIESLFPEMPYRSQLWHTLTSSFVAIIGSIVTIGLLIVRPFKKNTNPEISSYIVLWGISLIICAGVIWLEQFLFGLIPVILNRAYINYTIQILFQVIWLVFIIKFSKVKK